MGVTIYYKGKLKNYELLNKLVEEVEDLSKSNDWPFKLYDFEASEDGRLPAVKGIIVSPKNGSESVAFMFTPKGKLISMLELSVAEMHNEKLGKYAYNVSCKTQFAGVDFHIQLCGILRYLGEKYFKEWEVYDETKYYETGNRLEVERQIGVINRGIEALSDAFEAHGDSINVKDEKDLVHFVTDVLGKDISVSEINLEEE